MLLGAPVAAALAARLVHAAAFHCRLFAAALPAAPACDFAGRGIPSKLLVARLLQRLLRMAPRIWQNIGAFFETDSNNKTTMFC